MANEELDQRGYLASGKLKGGMFGVFEELNIGATSVAELVAVGVRTTPPTRINFPLKLYKAPKKPISAKPDRVFFRRDGQELIPVAVSEHKAPAKLRSQDELLKAAEQGLYAAAALGADVAITTNGQRWFYIDVPASLAKGEIVYCEESRDLNPGVLQNLLARDAGVVKDPKPLAEKVWQIIWHATKEEPKACLLTFVEIFVLKFLSDNLPTARLPEAYRFYELLLDPAEFENKHGATAIEYYVSTIRPHIKKLFPDNVVVQDETLPPLFGLKTLVSKTSVINGFAFLKSSEQTLSSFNRTFREILDAFNEFGPLTTIDPEFKLRLYETFLKRSARQQKLGQFFTPRNIVKPMIRMARLHRLPLGALVLDPAAGVGGFVLEPLLLPDALPGNARFERGKALRRVKTIGVDVDANMHILAKANTLIHLAEAVRDPTVTVPALNQMMAETFILMNQNETLGALENPVRDAADVILTNPPYVTQGSKIYRDEIDAIGGTRNGLDVRDYYRGCGLGVEALFLRYISGALKPGGSAFVIVPMGMLNRTESGPKAKLLQECDILASISLPRNAFFNTAQPTYILALGRRHTAADPRPDVFCALTRSIGETLDYRRIPTPTENDLEEVAALFVRFLEGDRAAAEASPLVKIVSADRIGADDRWDVSRFWSQDELVALGQLEPPIERTDFIDEARERLAKVADELVAARDDLVRLTSGPMRLVPLSDKDLFSVRSGTRIRQEDIRHNPGDVTVYSCFTDAKTKKGEISADWLKKNNVPIVTKPIVTVMANGASAVGRVYVRNERCVVTDDVIIVEPLTPNIDVEFLGVQLRSEIERGNFVYEAKLFAGRVSGLSVQVPVTTSGTFDLTQQRAISSAVRRFDSIRERIHELGNWSKSVRVA